MAKVRQVSVLAVFAGLSLFLIVFFAGTDTFQLFSVAKLSLDATGTKDNADQRGVDASSGIFKGEAKLFELSLKQKFKEPKAPKNPQCKSPTNPKCQVNPVPIPVEPPRPTPPPVTCTEQDCSQIPQEITVIDLRTGDITEVEVIDNGVTGGGGVASSTVGLGGFQTFIKDKVTVHDRFHTPANGQTTTGSLLLDWGHKDPITVTQFLVPSQYYDWFEVKLPQTIAGKGMAFKGISSGEFKYKLTIPKDLIDKQTVIPVRLVIQSKFFVVNGLADIEIERPVIESKKFSFAEYFRSIFTEVRR